MCAGLRYRPDTDVCGCVWTLKVEGKTSRTPPWTCRIWCNYFRPSCLPPPTHSQWGSRNLSAHQPSLSTLPCRFFHTSTPYSYTQHPKSSPYSFHVCPLLVFTPICTNHETQVVRVWKTNTPIPVSGSCSTTSSPSASHCVYAGRELKEVNCSFSSPSTGHTLHSVSVLSHHTTWQYSGRRDET